MAPPFCRQPAARAAVRVLAPLQLKLDCEPKLRAAQRPCLAAVLVRVLACLAELPAQEPGVQPAAGCLAAVLALVAGLQPHVAELLL